MGKVKWVDKNHYRVVSDDGRRSWLRKSGGLFGPDTTVEVADHHKDGTTDAYEVDDSIIGKLFNDSKGKHKEKRKDC